jgi:hypothetical protein
MFSFDNFSTLMELRIGLLSLTRRVMLIWCRLVNYICYTIPNMSIVHALSSLRPRLFDFSVWFSSFRFGFCLDLAFRRRPYLPPSLSFISRPSCPSFPLLPSLPCVLADAEGFSHLCKGYSLWSQVGSRSQLAKFRFVRLILKTHLLILKYFNFILILLSSSEYLPSDRIRKLFSLTLLFFIV